MSIIIWGILLVCVSIGSMFVGVADLDLTEILSWSETEWELFLMSRIPRLLSILLAGAGMSIAGLIMQQITQNRFVSPTTAGTMDFAKLGIVVSMIGFSDAHPLIKMLISFGFAFGGSLLFMRILERIKMKDVIFIPLVGLMLGSIVGALTTFLALRFNLLQSLEGWMQGNFSMITKGRYELLYITVPLLFIAYRYAHRFTIVGMGEEFSQNLGISHKRVMQIGLAIVSLIASAVILSVGVIPFLGLIVPNLISIWYGDHLRKTLPLTALFGALFVLVCDIAGRLLIAPYEIPISLMVGTIGSGLFLYLLFRRDRYGLS